jgi:hypothetical protein
VSSILSMPLSPTPPAVDPSMAQPEAPQYQAQGLGVGNLNRNPMLPQHPLGAYTDSQYEAELAQLKFEVAQRYNDVLQQLGYTDDNGNFVPGQVEIDSNRQKSELARNIQLADEQTTQQHQQQGTLFSGLRGTNQARAEYPFVNAMGQLGVDTPKKLSDLYGQAGGLVNEFTVRNNLLLANAAQRAAANLANNSAAGGNVTGVPGGFGGTPPPGGGGINGSGVQPNSAEIVGPGVAIAQPPAGAGLTVPTLPNYGNLDQWSRLNLMSAPPTGLPSGMPGAGGGGRATAV